jgi:hypothetical protein
LVVLDPSLEKQCQRILVTVVMDMLVHSELLGKTVLLA